MTKNIQTKHNINNFVKAEVQAIQIAKWLEGERLNKDPGDDFIPQWIQKHAKEFRQKWKESKCQYCSKKCRYKNISKCSNFKLDKK